MKSLLAALALALGVTPALAENGRYIVKFVDGRSDAAVNALNAAGARVALKLGPQNAVAAYIPERALAGLSHNPSIEYIEEDVIRTPMALWNNVPAGGSQTLPYGVQMVQADKVGASAPNAAAKKICIIDSGYSPGHEDLPDSVGFTNNNGSGTWNKDSCGHGSHVAGTIAAELNTVGVIGVNPGASLHIVKVFGDDDLASGSCDWTYSSNLVSALNACTSAGAKIVSMSLGGSLKSRTEENAFKSAYNNGNGVLSIAAAGNAGNKSTSYPAGYASVMSVAAVDADENVASFSQQNRDVEIAAPGVAVLSTVPWLEDNSFTSGGDTVSGGHVEFSARGSVSGTVANGSQCTAAGSWAGQVVLCQRGTNSFYEKVQNVKAGGGIAAVIYNNVASDPTCGDFLGTLGDGNSSTIMAISVSCDDGTAALTHVGQTGSVASNVTFPGNGYEAWDGTSMATPHVSGVAALVWGCNQTKTAGQVRNALTSTAKDKGAAGRDSAYGYGIVQARTATASLGNANGCTITP